MKHVVKMEELTMSTLYSIGAMNQLADSLENAGFTSGDVTRLKQFKNLSEIKGVLNGSMEIKPRWREENGTIRISLTTNGLTGNDWISRLESIKPNYSIGDYHNNTLLSPVFESTKDIITEVVIIKDYTLHGDCDPCPLNRSENSSEELWIRTGYQRSPGGLWKLMEQNGFTKPTPEIACLLFEFLTKEDFKEMGLNNVIVMHEPFDGNTFLGMQDDWLFQCNTIGGEFEYLGSYAFIASQKVIKPL